jgi:hydroxypyruvate isomerase
MIAAFSERFVANISMLFTERPFVERPAAAVAAGFTNIECWWPFDGPDPSASEIAIVTDAIMASGAGLRGFNFYAGDMAGGERGVACRLDRQAELDRSTDILLRIARTTGCRAFNLLYGQIDPTMAEDAQHLTAAEAIGKAASRVAEIGGLVLLEPLAEGLNGAYPLLRPEDVVTRLGGPLSHLDNVRLLFDTFHLASNGVDILPALRAHAAHIGHVQFADFPGRGEPGTGRLPFPAVLRVLREIGYAGYIAFEYRPTVGPQSGLALASLIGEAWSAELQGDR